MAGPRPSRNTPSVRRFTHAGLQRLEEARFFFQNGYRTAAVYLGGYAIECLLKALILAREPTTHYTATLASFRSAKGHSFEWLKSELFRRRECLPLEIARQLTNVSWWNTELRYDPVEIPEGTARDFLDGVARIVSWVQGRI